LKNAKKYTSVLVIFPIPCSMNPPTEVEVVATRRHEVLLALLRTHLPTVLKFQSVEFQTYLTFCLLQERVSEHDKVQQILEWRPDAYSFMFLCVALNVDPRDFSAPGQVEGDPILSLVKTFAAEQNTFYTEKVCWLARPFLRNLDVSYVVSACDHLNRCQRALHAFLLCLSQAHPGLSRQSVPLMLIADLLKATVYSHLC